MATPTWNLSGHYYETCSCDFVCPCLPGQMAVTPTKGACTFAMAFDIGFALMIVLFAVGVMNLVFVAALALFVLIEKTGPAGVAVGRVGGVLLIAAGVAMLATG